MGQRPIRPTFVLVKQRVAHALLANSYWTIKVTLKLWINPPEVAEIVIVYVPVGVCGLW